MRPSRTVFSLATTGALALSGVLLAAPASAAPESAACVAARQTLLAQQQTLTTDEQALAQARQFGNASQVINAQAQVTQDQAVLAVDQATVNAQCGTTVPLPTPTPTPRPRLTCAQIGSNIPASDPNYRRYLDVDGDGIACEIVTSPPVGATRVVNGKNCRWSGTAWVPITDPCNCTPEPTPPPVVLQRPVIVQQPVQVVQPAPQTIVQQPPVVVSPAQVFTTQETPSIAATSAGDGSLAGLS